MYQNDNISSIKHINNIALTIERFSCSESESIQIFIKLVNMLF